MYVHARDCWTAGKQSAGISREQALRALADGIKGCTDLGLEGLPVRLRFGHQLA
ncbi:DUF6233 domain-containing protein [Streptomyces sp. NPDC059866]|uniref:DUF6233 domain-containing protein n=1 Tax=Streptomyces sp. NPDC059866 TaxID=3346978 RepID=UPI00365063C3